MITKGFRTVRGSDGQDGSRCLGCGKPLSRYNPGTHCQACVSSNRKDEPAQTSGRLIAGAKLAELRHERGMTQDMLADRAGLSASLVQKLEGDFRRSVRISTLSALARVLKVPVSVLLGDEPSEGSALPGGQPVKARVSGGTLRAWRRSRGWDVPDMARRLRRAAGGQCHGLWAFGRRCEVPGFGYGG